MNQPNMGVVLVHPPEVKSLLAPWRGAAEQTRADMGLDVPPEASFVCEGIRMFTAVPLALESGRSARARWIVRKG